MSRRFKLKKQVFIFVIRDEVKCSVDKINFDPGPKDTLGH
jgi:hypothetical protein